MEERTMTTARLLLAVVLVALISAFLNPDLAFSLEGLAVFLGFLLAIGIVLVSFELPGLLVHRRVVGETGRLRVLPWAIVIAAVFVLVSRVVQLQPGYLSDLSVPALMAALGVFALFGAFSVLFWAYFRFRPARTQEPAER